MKYRHMIWDYNGTLLNDVELCVQVINEMLEKRNLPQLTLQTYRELFDFPVKDYYARIGFNFNKESFEIVGTEFIVEYDKRQRSSRLHQGIAELLHLNKQKGIHQSVHSARKEQQLLEEMKFFGILD
jgi:phosphoglycolate phosphatase